MYSHSIEQQAWYLLNIIFFCCWKFDISSLFPVSSQVVIAVQEEIFWDLVPMTIGACPVGTCDATQGRPLTLQRCQSGGCKEGILYFVSRNCCQRKNERSLSLMHYFHFFWYPTIQRSNGKARLAPYRALRSKCYWTVSLLKEEWPSRQLKKQLIKWRGGEATWERESVECRCWWQRCCF